MKVFVSTIPFSFENGKPMEILKEAGFDVVVNPLGRKIKGDELLHFIEDVEVLIAGTEEISRQTLERCRNLKLIARVGIGLDGVDLLAAQEMGIDVTYTPDAPAPAVAELTLALLLSSIRKISLSDKEIKRGTWFRYSGKRISELKIGIIGAGRIGSRVIRRLSKLGTAEILVNDLFINDKIDSNTKLEWCSKEEIYKRCDVVTFHLPLSSSTKNLVTKEQFDLMKEDVVLINTSRGGILNESDLFDFLTENNNAFACVDVFEQEPYNGDLVSLDNVMLTAHLGSMTRDCRARMEIEACEEALRLKRGFEYVNPVPISEYSVREK